MRKMLITFGAVIAALALSGVPAVTASAAPVPVIYNYGPASYHKLYVTLSGVKSRKGRPQVSSQVPGRLAPAPRARAAGPKARIQQGAAPRRAGGDVPAALLKSQQ